MTTRARQRTLSAVRVPTYRHRRPPAAAGLCAALFGGFLATAQAETPAERAVHYRQGVFEAMGWHFGALRAMVRGDAPYEAGRALHHAEAVAALSKMVAEGFPAGSDTGAPTEALPAIWEKPDAFAERVEALIAAGPVLVEAAKGGTQQALGPGLQAAGGACKACHDSFRKED